MAWQLDGEDVPAEHGGPLRLVVPGWYGIWWVKWPVEVRLSAETAETFDGFWQNQRYTYQDDEGRVLSAVRDQLPRAVLTWPYDGAVVSGDASIEILAWAGEHAVTSVELSADDGATWLRRTTSAPGPARGAGHAGTAACLPACPAVCAGSRSGPPTPPAAHRRGSRSRTGSGTATTRSTSSSWTWWPRPPTSRVEAARMPPWTPGFSSLVRASSRPSVPCYGETAPTPARWCSRVIRASARPACGSAASRGPARTAAACSSPGPARTRAGCRSPG